MLTNLKYFCPLSGVPEGPCAILCAILSEYECNEPPCHSSNLAGFPTRDLKCICSHHLGSPWVVDFQKHLNCGHHAVLYIAQTLSVSCENCKWDWVSKTNGGVPPFGHSTQLRVFIDPDLLQYDEVWAAAGTWNDVFGIEPHKLVEASGGARTDLKRG